MQQQDVNALWAEECVSRWLALYSADDACLADLLCDRRDPASLAYRIAVADGGSIDVSCGDLRAESERFAAALAALGIGPGDRVATLMGKSRDYLFILMGIWRLGAVHVPLFTAFAPAAISYRLLASDAVAVVSDADQLHKLLPGEDMPALDIWRITTRGAPDRDALSYEALMAAAKPGFPAAVRGGDAPMIHIFTSGTTGRAKGVEVPVRALAAIHAYAIFGLDLRPDDLYWCGADPGWAYGLYFGILSSLVTATPSLLAEGGFSSARTLALLSEHGVTNFAAAPTVFRAIRSSGLPVPEGLKLRCVSSAGEPLTPEINEWATGALGVAVHDHYGQTEVGMLVNNHHNPRLRKPLKVGSMGTVMPGWDAAVLDEREDREVPAGTMGRVAMRVADSPLAWFTGYAGATPQSADKFTADGTWYLTGDTGSVDADGYFRFSAREDDVIIMAGYRIGPGDVESVLSTHPAIAESAVIAVPDAIRGEVIEAYVVLRGGYRASSDLESELQTWVKTRFAAHAFPRAVHWVETLPKTPSGKVQRIVLREQRRRELASQA